jgi:hypothetical protein
MSRFSRLNQSASARFYGLEAAAAFSEVCS